MPPLSIRETIEGPSFPSSPSTSPATTVTSRKTHQDDDSTSNGQKPPVSPRPLSPHLLLKKSPPILVRKRNNTPRNSECDIYNAAGNAAYRAGNLGRAVACYQKTLSATSAATAPEHRVTALANLGTIYWTTGQIEKAISVFLEALHQYSTALTAHTMASIYHQLGLCYALVHEFEYAQHALEQAVTIRQEYMPDDHEAIARTIDAMGKVYFLQGKYQDALEHHVMALESSRCASSCGDNTNTCTMDRIKLNLIAVYVKRQGWAQAMEVCGTLHDKKCAHQTMQFLHQQQQQQQLLSTGSF